MKEPITPKRAAEAALARISYEILTYIGELHDALPYLNEQDAAEAAVIRAGLTTTYSALHNHRTERRRRLTREAHERTKKGKETCE